MKDPAVVLESVTKVYKTYDRPFDRLTEMLFRGHRVLHRTFYALRDVSFSIERGTTFGILGRNGSGKSTALQIICEVLQPTSGIVKVNGRVSALLELGSGFNPEFSGIDNVYLYASILGLTRDEISQRLPAILDFAEIGDFVYQPIKTYSSGMVVRLAFAVAISIDPDILVVDEALSVGDALFQHKCMLRMKQIMQSGATVIFVSHDLASVQTLCQQAILLEHGQVVASGTAQDVSREYHRRLFADELALDKPPLGADFGASASVTKTNSVAGICLPAPNAPSEAAQQLFAKRCASTRFGTGEAQVIEVEIFDSSGQRTTAVSYGQRFCLRIYVKVHAEVQALVAGFNLRDPRGLDITVSNTLIEKRRLDSVRPGECFAVDFELQNLLRDDHYSIAVAITEERYFHQARPLDWVDGAVILRTLKPADTIVYGVYYPNDLAVNIWREVGTIGNHQRAA